MKITKQRLQQIIQEEITSYKASQLNESIDVDTLDNLEASVTPELANAVIAAYEEMTTPIEQDQAYADTGEPVSKDPEVMHQKAVELIGQILLDQSKKTHQDGAGINEDGHTDVPSAARKMKLAIEDAGQILAAIEGGEGDLPAWWMSKVTIASDYLNKARDYLLGGPESKTVGVVVPSDDINEQ